MAIPTLNPSDVFGAYERGLTARNVNLLRGQEQEDRRNTLAAQQQSASQQQVINRLIAESTGPDGNVDRARLSIGLANAGQGGAIFGAQENVDKNAAAVANIGKTRAETSSKSFETSQKNRDYYNRAMSALANRPDLNRDMVIQAGRDLAAQGVIDPNIIESGEDKLPDDPAQLRRVLNEGLVIQLTPDQQSKYFAPDINQFNLGGSMEGIDFNPNSPTYRQTVLSRTTTPDPAAVARQKLATASASAPGAVESEYQRTVAEAAGKRDIEAFDAVQNAARDLERDYKALELLNEGTPITGYMADAGLEYNRIIAKVGGNKDAARKVQDSELLNALLGQDVFANIQTLGIGARGLDTPAEREYLREVVSGVRPLNEETLRRMAEIRANVKEKAIDNFNARIKRGELDAFFKASMQTKSPIERPQRPKPRAAPASKPPAAPASSPNIRAEAEAILRRGG